jgi:hypothetical protein
MSESQAKSAIRPIYGTLIFQPFAYLWCVLTDTDYLTSIGPFTIFCMFCFIPIYRYYDQIYAFFIERK